MRFLTGRASTLAAKFNLLAIGLITATSLGISAFVVRQQSADSYAELLNRGASLAAMIAQNSEFGIYTEDKRSLGQLIDGVAADRDIAYLAIMNSERKSIVAKNADDGAAAPQALGGRTAVAGSSALWAEYRDSRTGGDFIDLLAPVVSAGSAGGGDLLGLEIGAAPAAAEPKTIGYVQLGLTKKNIGARIRAFLFSTLAVTVLFLLGGVAVTLVLSKRIAAPINRLVKVAGDIADGRLTHTIERDGTVEIAALADAIGRLRANLADMIGKVSGLAGSVAAVAGDITNSPASVLRVVDAQKKGIEQAAGAVMDVNASIAAMSTSAVRLREAARDASSASAQLTGYVSQVADNADLFDRTAQEAASSVTEMLASIREIGASVGTLSAASAETTAALHRIDGMIKDIREHADESVRLADRVSAEASGKGTAAATAAIAGIERVRDRMGGLAEVINGLAKRSKEINSIISVIDEVAGQTGLLALNASILAAQAGQQGGAFAVVADEIKKLAERASFSTKEIARLITAVQTEAQASVVMAGEGTAAVDDGMHLVAEVSEALRSIQKSAAQAVEKSRAIQRSTVEEASAIRDITEAVRNQNQQVELISRSTEEQTKGSKLILTGIERVKSTARQIMAATSEQLSGSKRISSVSDSVSTQAAQITAAMENQRAKTEEIVAFTANIQKTTADLVASAGEMNDSIVSLSNDAGKLTEELKRFQA